MRKSLLAMAVVGLVGSTACATKGYVNTQVGQVSTKVDTLSGSLEETQERTRQNEAKITEVDGKAGAAQTAANTAQQAAMTADGKAVSAAYVVIASFPINTAAHYRLFSRYGRAKYRQAGRDVPYISDQEGVTLLATFAALAATIYYVG